MPEELIPRTRRRSKVEVAKLIIAYLDEPEREDYERNISDIADSIRVSYSTVRRTMLEYFPHSFLYSDLRKGWFSTGKSLSGMSGGSDFEQAYNQDALRYLDRMRAEWPDERFAGVLRSALASGSLDQLRILGETIARAATETKTLGAVPEKLR